MKFLSENFLKAFYSYHQKNTLVCYFSVVLYIDV